MYSVDHLSIHVVGRTLKRIKPRNPNVENPNAEGSWDPSDTWSDHSILDNAPITSTNICI